MSIIQRARSAAEDVENQLVEVRGQLATVRAEADAARAEMARAQADVGRNSEALQQAKTREAQAAEALLIAANQLTIARALACVFISDSGTYYSTLAGRATTRLVQLAAEDYYADDERHLRETMDPGMQDRLEWARGDAVE